MISDVSPIPPTQFSIIINEANCIFDRGIKLNTPSGYYWLIPIREARVHSLGGTDISSKMYFSPLSYISIGPFVNISFR
jgi:hypothetical protein